MRSLHEDRVSWCAKGEGIATASWLAGDASKKTSEGSKMVISCDQSKQREFLF